MKKLFLLPIMALMLCVVSCEEDKGSEPAPLPDTPKSKVLTSISVYEIEDEYEDEDPEYWVFEYDRNGNVVSATEIEDGYDDVTTYSWEGEEIVVNDGDSEIEDGYYSYTVRNGKIVEMFDFSYGEVTTFAYDVSGCLKNMVEVDDDEEVRCAWSNGRLLSISKVDNEDSYTRSKKLYYSDEKCNGFFPLLGGLIYDDELLFRAMPQLIGAAQTALPYKMVVTERSSYNDYQETYTYKYTFYNDGYLKSCIETSDSDDEKTVYRFKWQ